MNLTEKIIEEFEERFTLSNLVNGSDATGENEDTKELQDNLKSFLLSSLKQIATEAIEAVRLEEKKSYYGCITHRGLNNLGCDTCQNAIIGNSKQSGYNSAVTAMEQKAKKFLLDNF